jgi:NTE family protein
MKKIDSAIVNIENVLVLQGGGSLGAYECGVYKTLDRHGIRFDIVAGTSIGAVNAAIIVGAKKNPARDLEDFWLSVAENITPSFISDNVRPSLSVLFGSIYGNRNVFEPKWIFPYEALYYCLTSPYLYSVLPLENTLEAYVDFGKINSNNNENQNIPRLIVTAADIQTSKSVTFDSMNTDIDLEHIMSCVGYPFYGISWIKKDGRYLWDGSLQSNTPLREVIDASPKNDKNVYIVSLFPQEHHDLPSNMFETWHRARDIIYTDKTSHNVRMSEVFSRYIRLIEGMHEIITSSTDERAKSRFRESSEREYRKLVQKRGAIIRNIVRIERSEDTHFLFEDADFSLHSIKHLIKRGEEDAEEALNH